MFDQKKYNSALAAFKQDFVGRQWPNEKYKWEAVKWFQDHWDVNAPNFAEMLSEALKKTYNLLASMNNYPRKMIERYAKEAPEDVRAMFIALFDETTDIWERIDAFKRKADELKNRFTPDVGQHYQNENAITTYLWLRYPDKYYIYKLSEVKKANQLLGGSYAFRNGAYASNIRGCLALFNEIHDALILDYEMTELFREQLTATCYPDPQYRTLTQTFCFYVSRFYDDENGEAIEDRPIILRDEWRPTDDEYHPGIDKDGWLQLVNNPEIIGPVWGGLLAAFCEFGGEATCSQIARKYNKSESSVSGMCTQFCTRIFKEVNCPRLMRENKISYWAIAFLSKSAPRGIPGAVLYRLRPELQEALSEVDIMKYRWDMEGNSEKTPIDEWFPSDYSPNISVAKWVELLNDETVFSPDCLAIMKRFKNYGGAATCAQLAVKYGGSANFYNGNSSTLAKRVAEKTGCPVRTRDSGKPHWWPILYLGKSADKNTDRGVFIWKLRDELSQALDQVDLSGIPLYVQDKPIDIDQLHSDARFKKWFMPVLDALISLGGEASRQVVHEKIITKYGITDEELSVKNKSGNAVVINDIDWARNYLNYEGFLDSSVENGIWKLTDIGKKVLVSDDLAGMIIAKWVRITKAKRENTPIPVIDLSPYYNYRSDYEKYDKSAFLRDVYISEARYERLKAVLLRKKNIILQGAPGVGKTFAARRLAWSIMGEQDDSRIEFVQFHQNYSYEDFVMGYKPEGGGFDLKYGVFYRFCQKANNRPGVPHFFIIDEINRGNLSKIFGELLMLIEPDYRNTKVKLAYSDVPFSVPENLYIIGMMNTADRSLALIDYALRRRFSFFDMEPGFDSEGFGKYQAGLENETFDALIDRVRELNRDIIQDKALGKGFCIGHSYFCGLKSPEDCTAEWMRDVVDYDILQMLGEYWFDDEAKLQRWENSLRGVFQ